MSTKIHNGWIIKTTSIRVVDEILDRVRQRSRQLAKKELRKLWVHDAVRVLDEIDFHLFHTEEKGICPLSHSWLNIMDKCHEIEKTQRRNPKYDYSFSVVVFPRRGYFLALTYCEKSLYTQIWSQEKSIRDYTYWNNTDMPKNISTKEWNKRERDWDKAIKYNTPAESGFTRDIIIDAASILSPNIEHLEKTDFPSLSERVDYISERITDEKFVPNVKKVTPDNVSNVISTYNKWTQTSEYKNVLQKNKIEVRKKLRKRLTPKKLLESYVIN